MYTVQRTRPIAKSTFIPKRLVSLPALLKKRMKSARIQAIKTELAARTLYVVDGDEIVITSLDKKPFCCQEELSVMCRSELCRVARELNRKLPGALRIEPLSQMSSEAVRISIEEMMGFRHLRKRDRVSVAQTQPTIELASLFSQVRKGKRSPTSSFSSATSRSSAPYGLAVVDELDEDSGEMPWPVPKIKLAYVNTITMPPHYELKIANWDSLALANLSQNNVF